LEGSGWRVWLAGNGLQKKKGRKSRKGRKKVCFFWSETPVFLPKRARFLKRNLQVALVVMVKNEAKWSRE
jgi:predicted transcriptional regulator